MKICDCGRERPDTEEGSICTEYNADGSIYREYWVCDHCCYVFDNDCDCEICQRYEAVGKPIGSKLEW